jgi:hypothetical protein
MKTWSTPVTHTRIAAKGLSLPLDYCRGQIPTGNRREGHARVLEACGSQAAVRRYEAWH